LGGEAPDIRLGTLLQGPEPHLDSLRPLRGNVVVLEFWATWCPPCVESIPHLNRLAVKLKDMPVRFISITDEPLAHVRKFLVDQPMAGWIGIDEDGSAFKTYGARGRPMTVVIGPDGLIAAVTFPDELTDKALLDVLAGRRPEGLSYLPSVEPVKEEAPGKGPLVSISVSTAPADEKFDMRITGHSFSAKGLPFRILLAQVYDVPQDRIELAPELAASLFNVEASIRSDNRGALEPLLQQAAAAAARVRIERERRVVDVYLLSGDKAGPALIPSDRGGHGATQWGPGLVRGAAQDLDWLARALEDSLDRPVVNESRLRGRFDFELEWKPEKGEKVDAPLAQLGFRLTPDRRPVELLVVSPAEKVVK
jgi:uncharacterized protein (TIGR03435 family)